MQPLFSVEENNKFVLSALPKTYISKRLVKSLNHHEEMMSTAVYIPIFKLMPWITHILQDRRNCIYPKE